MANLRRTLTLAIAEQVRVNLSAPCAERWETRHGFASAHHTALDSFEQDEQADRMELVFATVDAWEGQGKEDKKELSRAHAIEAVAHHMGDRSPKTLSNWAKLRTLGNVDTALAQVEKLTLQSAIDTTCKVGAVPAKKVASHCYNNLTNFVQGCTRYFKRYMESEQAEGRGLLESIESFNALETADLKALFDKAPKVDRETFDKAIARIKYLEAELRALKDGAIEQVADESTIEQEVSV